MPELVKSPDQNRVEQPAVASSISARPPRPTLLSSPLIKLSLVGAGLWLASGLVSTLVSYDPGLSIRSLLLLVAGLVIAVFIVWAKSFRVWMTYSLALSGGAFALYFLLQGDLNKHNKFPLLHSLSDLTVRLVPDLGWHKPHPNVAAGVLEIALPFCVALAFSVNSVWRWLLLGAALLCGYSLLLTESRGAWASVALALAGVGLLYVYTLWRKGQLSGRTFGLIIGLIGLGVIALAVIITALTLQNPALIKSSDRLKVQSEALSLVLDYPFTGAGMGTFEEVFSQYVLFHNSPPEPHAHDLWLNLWISQGLAGVIGYALLTIATGWAVIQILRTRQKIAPLFWASLIGWFTLLIHGLPDDVHYQSWALPLLSIVPAFLLASAPLPPGRKTVSTYRKNYLAAKRLIPVIAGLAFSLIILVVSGGGSVLLSLFQSNIGNLYQTRADLNPAQHSGPAAEDWLNAAWLSWSANPSATRHAPFLYFNQHRLDKALDYHARTQTSLEEWPKMGYYFIYHHHDSDLGLSIEQVAAKLGTTNPLAYYVSAEVYAGQGKLSQAIASQQHALELDPNPPAEKYLRLGSWLEQAGDKPAALNAYRRAALLDPTNQTAKQKLTELK